MSVVGYLPTLAYLLALTMMKKQLFSTTQVASLGAYVETTTATVTVIPLCPQGIASGLTLNARLAASVPTLPCQIGLFDHQAAYLSCSRSSVT